MRPVRLDEGLRTEVGDRAYVLLAIEAQEWPTPLWWLTEDTYFVSTLRGAA